MSILEIVNDWVWVGNRHGSSSTANDGFLSLLETSCPSANDLKEVVCVNPAVGPQPGRWDIRRCLPKAIIKV